MAPAANSLEEASLDSDTLYALHLLHLLQYPAMILSEEGQIIATNEWMAKTLLVDKEMLRKRCIFDFIDPAHHTNYAELMQSACDEPIKAHFTEVVCTTSDEQRILLRSTIMGLHQSRPQRFLAVYQPLQEWLPLLQEVASINELLLERNDQLAKLNAQLRQMEEQRERMTTMIIHDIRGPLLAMTYSYEVIKRALAETTIKEPMGTMISESIEAGLRSSQTIVDLTDNLLRMKQLASGQYTLVHELFSVTTLAEDLTLVLLSTLNKNQVRLHTTIVPSKLELYGDQSLLRRVVLNLLTNAIRFTPMGGTIDLYGYEEDAAVVVVVADQGPGVAPGDRERIFEAFVQGKGEQSRGTGLGLAFCREVVHAHGGRIWVEERPGGGSRFCIRLPMHDV